MRSSPDYSSELRLLMTLSVALVPARSTLGTMNFFGGSSPPSANNQQLKMAKAEVKMYSDLFNK